MNISEPFIRRPVGTTLLAGALLLVGTVAYYFLPVATLPSIDYSVVSINAQRPGADPATMAASVAAPLERRLANIAGVTEMTSTSQQGSTRISVQFEVGRNIDAAGRDVQAAINAAMTDLPGDMPNRPSFRKLTDTVEPVVILAFTSETVPTSVIFDAVDSIIAQRVAQIPGVAEARVSGAEQPAIRIQIDPGRLAAMGLGIEKVANAINTANAHSAIGSFNGDARGWTIQTSDQLNTPEEYRDIVIAANNGAVVKLKDVATVEKGVRNRLAAGWFNGKPAVLLTVAKQPTANVNAVVDRVKELLPELQRWIPAGVAINYLSDRTQTIRASVGEIQRTLLISIGLVMCVVFVFLRRATPMIAAGVTLPLSLLGTCAAMWAMGYSIDNLSLMALTVSVGFVVDDAIVMIENIETHRARGKSRMEAALVGSRQIGFTVVSISLSLLAVFIPILFMGGIMGRFLREFSFTLAFAILISTVVSLTVTPVICAWMPAPAPRAPSRFDRLVEGGLAKIIDWYARSLRPVVDHPWIMLVVIVATIGWTVHLYQSVPKGSIPQDDNGFINGTSEGSPDVSFTEMVRLQKLAEEIISADPDVVSVGSTVGGAGALSGTSNQGKFTVRLKPRDQRQLDSKGVIARIRKNLAGLVGVLVTLTPSQDVFLHARWSASQYQFTLLDADLEELAEWAPKVLRRLRSVPEIVDVMSDRQQGALKANLVVDRNAAARLGVQMAAIDAALNSSFGQRQDSVIYTERNQYRVIFEVPTARQRDLRDLSNIYVSNAGGEQVPLSSLARIERTTLPLTVNHQGVSPASTLSFNVAPGFTLQEANAAVERAFAEMTPPPGLRGELAGEAGDLRKVSGTLTTLILVALLAVYIILGILYESLVHPITIISTLPSAGLGALLALQAFGVEFSMIAFIGILLLIGIVKKNGIMLVDFALMAEREDGLSVHDAAMLAAKERFRPILMTTLAAMFGALPLAFATGIGTDLRRPLGITIVGGLLLSQILTLYTTPVIYLLMSKLRPRDKRTQPAVKLALSDKA